MKFIIKMFQILLYPFAIIVMMITSLRRFLYNLSIYKQEVFNIPVISIGNISLGGTGKTPMILYLLSKFSQYRIAVLSRGYKSKKEDYHALIKSDTLIGPDPDDFGDEPVLLSKKIKNGGIIIGKDRNSNLNRYYNEIDPSLVLLDDGFQYLKIFRDLDIVMIDATKSRSYYKVIPSGMLRESISTLRNADIVVLNKVRKNNDYPKLRSFIESYTSGLLVTTCYKPIGLLDTDFKLSHDLDYLKGKKVVLMAAISNKDDLKNTVEELGANIIHKFYFADHYKYQRKNIDKALNFIKKEKALIITTEKDMIKIRKWGRNDNILALQIELKFLEGEDLFLKKIQELL